ncbi:MAG: cadherin-like beta sandwich domain-containing protein [Lachnospiraceae bacterium]|jgi:hypothetical protein|nr:cadherin-like beta sandwich domain-containing protein [Lachnospiraceae bacterium]
MLRLRKYAAILFLAFVMAGMSAASAFAGVVISFSDPSTSVGETFSVTVKVASSDASLGKATIMLTYDPEALTFVSGESASGGAGSIKIFDSATSSSLKEMRYSLKFTALQAGTTQVHVGTTPEIYSYDNQPISIDREGQSTITVNALENYSSIAELSELIVSPGTLEPVFSPDVMEYRLSVGADVEKIIISATAKAGDVARVVVTGADQLAQGENKIQVTVTAQDGVTVRTYQIAAFKAAGADDGGDAADFTVNIGDAAYTLVSTWNETALPEGFEKQKYTYEGKNISIGRGLERDLTLVYLIDAEAQGAFYIYDTVAGTFAPYVPLETAKKSLVILSPDASVAIPAGLKETQVKILNQTVTAWLDTANSDYYVFYAMNWEGKKGFYRYDNRERTIQRYFEPTVVTVAGSPDGDGGDEPGFFAGLIEKIKGAKNKVLLIGLLALAAVLIIILIALVLNGRGRRRRAAMEDDDYDDGDDDGYDDDDDDDGGDDDLDKPVYHTSRTTRPDSYAGARGGAAGGAREVRRGGTNVGPAGVSGSAAGSGSGGVSGGALGGGVRGVSGGAIGSGSVGVSGGSGEVRRGDGGPVVGGGSGYGIRSGASSGGDRQVAGSPVVRREVRRADPGAARDGLSQTGRNTAPADAGGGRGDDSYRPMGTAGTQGRGSTGFAQGAGGATALGGQDIGGNGGAGVGAVGGAGAGGVGGAGTSAYGAAGLGPVGLGPVGPGHSRARVTPAKPGRITPEEHYMRGGDPEDADDVEFEDLDE